MTDNEKTKSEDTEQVSPERARRDARIAAVHSGFWSVINRSPNKDFNALINEIRLLAHAIGKSSQAADEATSDVLEQLAIQSTKRKGFFATEANPRTTFVYLMRMTSHAAFKVRKRTARRAVPDRYVAQLRVEEEIDQGEERLQERRAMVREAIRKLPDFDIALVEKILHERSSIAHIADALGVSTRTVERRYAAIVDRIEALLDKEEVR